MKKTFLIIVLGFLGYFSTMAQNVSAYQAGAYQPGLMNVRDLAPPSPGLILIDYNFWNNSKSYVDRFGKEVNSLEIDLTPIDPSVGIVTLDLEQQVSGYINVPVLFYAKKLKFLNATYMASINPVFMTSNYRANMHISDTNAFSSSNTGGLADIAFLPLGLGWSKDKFDISFFYTVYAPTGRYKTGADDNIGKGYWTHQFQAPFYMYFLDKATAFFVMPTFEVNGKVKGSDVRPGNRMTIEYGISQYVTPWLELEVINGHNWQVSDDKGDDVWWSDTQLDARDQVSNIGFGVGVWPLEGMLNIRAKYSIDYAVKQRYKSNFLSVSAIFIPSFNQK